MNKSAKSFGRKEAQYKTEPKVLVVCEDKKSSKTYLDEASLHFRVNLDIKVMHCGKTDPKGIVEYAIENLRRYDEVFCVIDRDTHLNFDEAVLLASRHQKIRLIRSYPCFEFWLIIHFGYCTRPFNNSGKKSAGDRAVEFLRTKPDMQDYAKGAKKIFSTLGDAKLAAARDISPKILANAVSTNTLNPSTEVHLIIDKMEDMSEPRLVKKKTP